MPVYYDKRLKPFSRKLRNDMTESERRLWSRIRRKQLKGRQFYRQKIVRRYIVDFYCPSAHVIVEVDGSQHLEKEAMRRDRIRDEYLRGIGFKVLRFSAVDVVRNTDGVVEAIYDCV